MPNPSFLPGFNLPRIKKPHPGSFCRLLFVPVSFIKIFPAFNIYTCEAVNYPILKPGYVWHQGALLRKNYREEKKNSDAGDYIETTVRAFLPFDDQRNSAVIDNLKHQNFILIAEMGRRFCRIVGTVENPVTLSYTFDTGEHRNDIAGTMLEWNWKSEDRPLLCSFFVPNSLIETLGSIATGGGGTSIPIPAEGV